MSSNVFITGARGYVGGRLTSGLIESGWRVTGSTRHLGIQPPGWPAGASLVELDPLGPVNDLASRLSGVQVVVHLAAANEIRSQADPDAALMETAAGTRHVLEAAILAGVPRFVFFSTVHVYGVPLVGDLFEDRAPQPRHPYAITHLAGEAFVLAAHDAGRIHGSVVRLTNAIGAPAWFEVDRWSLLGNDLARQAIVDGEIIVRTPAQWRDFIPMCDVIDGVRKLIEAPLSPDSSGVFNLGSGVAIQVSEVAGSISRLAGLRQQRAVPVRHGAVAGATETAPPFRVVLDRMTALGFVPSGRVSLDREIDATLALVESSVPRSKGS